jgi:hypothetical protein
MDWCKHPHTEPILPKTRQPGFNKFKKKMYSLIAVCYQCTKVHLLLLAHFLLEM